MHSTRQKGLVLIVFVVFLVLASSVYIYKTFDASAIQTLREQQQARVLTQAKQALIAFSAAYPSVGVGNEGPGNLPRPDYFAITEIPFDFDGTSDTGCINAASANGLPLIANGQNLRCLGRLAWKTIGLPISAPSENDPLGEMPWYAVSGNVADSGTAKFVNPKIVTMPHLSFATGSDVSLYYPWLTVRDSAGNVISNKVAAVIILPNAALAGQTRPIAPLASTVNYLDSIVVPVGCQAPCVPGNYSNSDFDNDFIIFDKSNPSANDSLVYITAEELMSAAERTVAQEAAVQLKKYYVNSSAVSANRFYPYAANLGDKNNACVDAKLSGLLPIKPAHANCTSAVFCQVDFPMTSVDFSLNSGLGFSTASGLCSRAAGSCKCTGAGSCRRGVIRFTCNAVGVCNSSGAGSNGAFQFRHNPDTLNISSTSGACIGNAGISDCNGIGEFFSPPTSCNHNNRGVSNLPVWFTDNRWQDYIYYTISNDCTAANKGCALGLLKVGDKTNIHAMVASPGSELATQNRTNNLISDYLDSAENTDGDNEFEATSKLKSSNYNDQTYIVAP